MAESEEVTGLEQPSGRRWSRTIIIIAVVVVIVAAMITAFLLFKAGGTDESEYVTGPAKKGNTFLVTMPSGNPVMLPPDGSDILTVSIVLEISPREEEGYDEGDAKEELEPLTSDNANKTKMPFVEEKIGMVLASRTKEEWISPLGQNLIKDNIKNELNTILRKGRVETVVFTSQPIIQ